MKEAMKIYRNPANAIIAALGPYLRRDGTDAGMTGLLRLNAQGIGNDSAVLTFGAAPGELATFTGGLTIGGNFLVGANLIGNSVGVISIAAGAGGEVSFTGGLSVSNSINLNGNTLQLSGDTYINSAIADVISMYAGGVLGIHVREDANVLEFKTFGSIVRKVTDVNATPYTVLQTDYYLQCRRTATGVLTVNLPSIAVVSTATSAFKLIIKDTGYNAAAFNITVVRNGADTIENVAANYTINADGTAIVLSGNATTNNWEIW